MAFIGDFNGDSHYDLIIKEEISNKFLLFEPENHSINLLKVKSGFGSDIEFVYKPYLVKEVIILSGNLSEYPAINFTSSLHTVSFLN